MFSFCVVCMYLCQSHLGPGAYQVTSYTGAARASRDYMVCMRVAWLHGLHTCCVVTWFAYKGISCSVSNIHVIGSAENGPNF